jgi:hypothetical protein
MSTMFPLRSFFFLLTNAPLNSLAGTQSGM